MPLMQQKILQTKRLGLIRALGKNVVSVVRLIHRREMMKLLGFPIMRYADIIDSEDTLRVVRFTPVDMSVDIMIKAPGGPIEQITMAFRRHKARGLPVNGLREEILERMDLFPQAMQQSPSIQYIPVPIKKGESKEKTK